MGLRQLIWTFQIIHHWHKHGNMSAKFDYHNQCKKEHGFLICICGKKWPCFDPYWTLAKLKGYKKI